MADGDLRIEVLEDEMKVLKGEVSRTLVDLRALLMREDSPLMTGGGLVSRIVAQGEASSPTQVNLAPIAVEIVPTVVGITLPGSPDVVPPALAGLPDLGATAMPGLPGIPDEGLIHSLEGKEASPPPDTPPSTGDLGLPDTPSTGELVLPDAPSSGDFTLPDAPSTGDFTLPNEGSAPGLSTVPDTGLQEEQDEERVRKRKARLDEEEALEEAEKALRARKRESDQEEEAAQQEAHERRKKRASEEAEELKVKEASRPASDPVTELKKAQLKDAEDVENLGKRKVRIEEEKEIEASERVLSNRKKEKDLLEEQKEDAARARRKTQADQEDEESEIRSCKRKREREEEEEIQALRESRRRADQDSYDEGPLRRPRGRDRGFERERMEMEYESDLQDEIEHFRNVRRRRRDLEVEMESFSESPMSQEDLDAFMTAGSETDNTGQESEETMDPMNLVSKALDMDGEDAEDDEDEEEYGSDAGYDNLSSAVDEDLDEDDDLEQDSDEDFEFSPSAVLEEEIGDDDDEYSDDLDDPAEPSSPQPDPLDNVDSYDYQEEPKINGNNGPRRPRAPEAGRRAYEGDYYQDRYEDDRSQEPPRRPQNAPRPQRAQRPRPSAPVRRRPPADDYGYAPNEGYSNWGQQPSGYEQTPNPQEWAPEPPPMDLNLVSNLVRWASMAKYKVGEKRLSDIIELYAQSRNAPPGLSKALIHIASIVDDQPPETGQTAQETMDLIAHLHGILTASLPVPSVPLIQGQISFATGNESANGGGSAGNGDW